MAGYVDLHIHSCFSDGTCTPQQLIRLAEQQQLSAIALTDHDTVAGCSQALSAAEHSGVELIPGIELSCLYQKQDVHMTGLFVDPQNQTLQDAILTFVNNRADRNRQMAEKLSAAGFPVTVEALKTAFPNAILTRAHFARYLTDRGFFKNTDEVFRTYIGSGCPCYVEKAAFTPEQAIHVIHAAGGLAILAHPFLYHMTDSALESMIRHFQSLGMDGMEVMYTTHTDAMQIAALKLAARYHLFKSGGSDFHGANKPDISLGTGHGNLRVPASYLTEMKRHLHVPSPAQIR